MISEPKSLKDIYVDHLNDLYSAENQISETLPNLIKFVNSPFLKKDLEYHLQETENRVKRLERIFEMLKENWNGDKNERKERCSEKGKRSGFGKELSPNQMGALFTARGQVGDPPQISSPYGTTLVIADMLGEKEAVELLTQTLEEEKATNVNLTGVGMMVVKIAALQDSEN